LCVFFDTETDLNFSTLGIFSSFDNILYGIIYVKYNI
jgi:hypothetical protein